MEFNLTTDEKKYINKIQKSKKTRERSFKRKTYYSKELIKYLLYHYPEDYDSLAVNCRHTDSYSSEFSNEAIFIYSSNHGIRQGWDEIILEIAEESPEHLQHFSLSLENFNKITAKKEGLINVIKYAPRHFRLITWESPKERSQINKRLTVKTFNYFMQYNKAYICSDYRLMQLFPKKELKNLYEKYPDEIFEVLCSLDSHLDNFFDHSDENLINYLPKLTKKIHPEHMLRFFSVQESKNINFRDALRVALINYPKAHEIDKDKESVKYFMNFLLPTIKIRYKETSKFMESFYLELYNDCLKNAKKDLLKGSSAFGYEREMKPLFDFLSNTFELFRDLDTFPGDYERRVMSSYLFQNNIFFKLREELRKGSISQDPIKRTKILEEIIEKRIYLPSDVIKEFIPLKYFIEDDFQEGRKYLIKGMKLFIFTSFPEYTKEYDENFDYYTCLENYKEKLQSLEQAVFLKEEIKKVSNELMTKEFSIELVEEHAKSEEELNNLNEKINLLEKAEVL